MRPLKFLGKVDATNTIVEWQFDMVSQDIMLGDLFKELLLLPKSIQLEYCKQLYSKAPALYERLRKWQVNYSVRTENEVFDWDYDPDGRYGPSTVKDEPTESVPMKKTASKPKKKVALKETVELVD